MANVIEFTDANFDPDVLRSSLPVLVDFTATWCGPCHQLAPVVAEIAAEYAAQLKVGKLDIDENLDVTTRYGVMSVPTLILFKNGVPVERLTGFRPKSLIMESVVPHLE